MSLGLLFASEITATVDGTVYAIDAGPTSIARAGSVGLALLVVTVVALGHQASRGARPLVALVPGILAAFFAAVVCVPPPASERSAALLFHDVLVLDAVATAFAAGAAFTALPSLLLARPGRVGVALALVTVAGSIGLGTVARRHARSLVPIDDLPYYTAKGRDDLHVGREREVEVELTHLAPATRFLWIVTKAAGPGPLEPEERALWTGPASLRVRAEAEGRFPVTATASRGPVRLTTTLWFRGRPEKASPLLPLRVGNRWAYRAVTTFDTGHLGYVKPIGGGSTEGRFEMEVVGADERDGFRTFTIAMRGNGHDETKRVIALEGRTLLADADDAEKAPAIEGTDSTSCAFPLLGVRGTCQEGGAAEDELPPPPPPPKKPPPRRRGAKPEPDLQRVPIRFALAGPVGFQTSDRTAAGQIGKGLLALVTLGLVILPSGSSTSYALVETHRGPADAPAAP
jgi:hypothetical protein